MAESAVSLAQLCAHNIAHLIGNDRVPPMWGMMLPSQFGDQLMEAMKATHTLNEDSLRKFTALPIQLSNIDLSHRGSFRYFVLSRLQKYRLESINIGNVHGLCEVSRFDLSTFVRECVSAETLESLRHLDISGKDKFQGIRTLTMLTGLESLSLSGRPMCHNTLTNVVRYAPRLRLLDISNTLVGDITSLKDLKNLEVLLMHNVKIRAGHVNETLEGLSKLRVLDISKNVQDYAGEDYQESQVDIALAVVAVLSSREKTPWPELRAVDMAGNSLAGLGIDQAVDIVNTVIVKSPKLSSISVMATPLESHKYTVPEGRNVTVVNCATRFDSLNALKQYCNTDRDVFAGYALHSVYFSLQSTYDDFTDNEVRECARVVCRAMKRHLANVGVQMAGSACLYHLCKMKRIRRLTPTEVQICMDRCLDAAETYRNMIQLQKNVWLTICNDYLLQLPGVNFYRTCKVALDSMLNNSDSSVARMTIAIVSIVTPKMRVTDAHALTRDDRYVTHLVRLMQDNLRNYTSSVDNNDRFHRLDNSLFTLKFTLSALWNLTDESVSTCLLFHSTKGMDTCFGILQFFSEQYNIQTKVLGILNNVAEVTELKSRILRNEFYLQVLCSCLGGPFDEQDDNGRYRVVERSYFAAGVLANVLLCTDWDRPPERYSREAISQKLLSTISQWPQLSSAMVSYRSFASFERILNETNLAGAQMWCLWGVNHVLTHRDKAQTSYTEMLCDSALPSLCLKLISSEDTHPAVRTLAARITEHSLSGL